MLSRQEASASHSSVSIWWWHGAGRRFRRARLRRSLDPTRTCSWPAVVMAKCSKENMVKLPATKLKGLRLELNNINKFGSRMDLMMNWWFTICWMCMGWFEGQSLGLTWTVSRAHLATIGNDVDAARDQNSNAATQGFFLENPQFNEGLGRERVPGVFFLLVVTTMLGQNKTYVPHHWVSIATRIQLRKDI